MRKILFRTETATQRFIQSQCLTTSVCSYARVVQNPDTPPPKKLRLQHLDLKNFFFKHKGAVSLVHERFRHNNQKFLQVIT